MDSLIYIQAALRAVVLQPGVMWLGSRNLLVVSTILPQALVQRGGGVESYSDASSGMATIMRNEVLNEPHFLFIYLSPYDLLRNFFSKNEPM
jgi:hypothetical protein